MRCSLKGNGPGVVWTGGPERQSTQRGNHVLQHRAVSPGLASIWTGQVWIKCSIWSFFLSFFPYLPFLYLKVSDTLKCDCVCSEPVCAAIVNHLWVLCCLSRQSELSVKLNRQLERCLRNSKCIDTESLCVVSGEKVNKRRVKQKHRNKNMEHSFDSMCVCLKGVADQGGCPHDKSRREPDGCC